MTEFVDIDHALERAVHYLKTYGDILMAWDNSVFDGNIVQDMRELFRDASTGGSSIFDDPALQGLIKSIVG